jgi:hypothetical protein
LNSARFPPGGPGRTDWRRKASASRPKTRRATDPSTSIVCMAGVISIPSRLALAPATSPGPAVVATSAHPAAESASLCAAHTVVNCTRETSLRHPMASAIWPARGADAGPPAMPRLADLDTERAIPRSSALTRRSQRAGGNFDKGPLWRQGRRQSPVSAAFFFCVGGCMTPCRLRP